MSMLIKGGTLVTAADTFVADLRVEGEQISQIGRDLAPAAGEPVVPAKGRYVFPGGVDAHTHFELPVMGTHSSDDFRTGSIAALCGGTTTFIDFAEPAAGQSFAEALGDRMRLAEKAAADYSFHFVIKEFGEDTDAQLGDLARRGITSFKCFMAYKGRLQIEDAKIIALLEASGRHHAMVMVHAENGEMIDALVRRFVAEGRKTPEYHWRARPAITEAEAVRRVASYARLAGRPIFVVHLSSAEGLAEVRAAVLRGDPVIAETCPQYLLLSSDLYFKPDFEGAKWVMSPPLRPADQLEQMWDGLRQGFIRTVGTDHCPFNFKGQKEMGRGGFTKIPNGIPAVGDRFNLLYTYGVGPGRLSLNRFVDVVATAPAKVFGLYPKKGSLAVGGDADLVIFNPEAAGEVSVKTSKHNVDYSAFEGMKLKGLPEHVLLRGKFAVRGGEYVGEQGPGRFLARGPSGQGW